MLTDSFYLPLLSFLLLLGTGIGNLWTGRMRLGFFQFSLAWILGDAALLYTYVLDSSPWVLPALLLSLHLLAWLSLLRFVFLRLRRRREAFQEEIQKVYRVALQAWMKGADEEVLPLARGLLRKDPWCFPALVLMAKVAFVSGKTGKARRWARRAALLTKDPDEAALIEEEVSWVVPKKKPLPSPPSKPEPQEKPPSGPEELPKSSPTLRAKGA